MLTLAEALQRVGRSRGREGAAKNARIAQALLSLCFAAGFAAVSIRAIYYAAFPSEMPSLASSAAPPVLAKNRPNIEDRNGRLLATDIRYYWLAAAGKEIPNPDDAAEKLAALFPGLDQAALSKRFHQKPVRFEWIKRGLTPNEANAVQALGIPGLSIFPAVGRVYPQGNGAAQIIGLTGADNEGLTGIERYIDRQLEKQVVPVSLTKRPIVKLSLDIGVQHVVAQELSQAMQRYKAEAALGLVMDVRNGEILASVSLPDFDPARREQALDDNRRNRVIGEIYEMGSVFKTFTIAMAIDQGVAGRYDRFDLGPVAMGRFRVTDPHATREPMSVEDIYIHSSNTGTARIAAAAGITRQRRFLESLGLSEKLETEAGTTTTPAFPERWNTINATTISYGYGVAVPPIAFASAFAAIVNGGQRIKPTFLLSEGGPAGNGERVVQPETSAIMRELMRLVVQRGTGKRARIAGLDIGGKTGTAQKRSNGHYSREHVLNSFVAAVPISDPKYLILVTLDEPKTDPPSHVNEAAYNAVPTAAAIIKRIAPMLDIPPAPKFDEKAATPYEQAGSNSPQRAVFRKSFYETSGFDPGYPAYREREPAPGPGDFGHYRR